MILSNSTISRASLAKGGRFIHSILLPGFQLASNGDARVHGQHHDKIFFWWELTSRILMLPFRPTRWTSPWQTPRAHHNWALFFFVEKNKTCEQKVAKAEIFSFLFLSSWASTHYGAHQYLVFWVVGLPCNTWSIMALLLSQDFQCCRFSNKGATNAPCS